LKSRRRNEKVMFWKKSKVSRASAAKVSKSELVEILIDAGVISLGLPEVRSKFVDLGEDVTFDELSIDSMCVIEIAVQLEDQLHQSFSPETISKQVSLNGLYSLISSTQKSKN